MVEVTTWIFIAFNLYLVVAVVFLLLDNKSAAASIAWILIFIILPLVGLIIYTMIGRDWRRVSRRKRLARQFFLERYNKMLGSLIRREAREIAEFRKKKGIAYREELMQLLHKNSNSLLTTSNTVEILQNGEEKFSALIKDLKKAEKFIHLEYFIWKDDPLTEKIKDVLVFKAREGVEVRILYDAFGGFFLSRSYKKELRKAGVKIFPYFNFLSPFMFHTLNYRNHRKIAVIDGKVGYTGGMNMAKEYMDGGKRFKTWRDTHLRVRGDLVEILQNVFAVSWYNTTREELFSRKYFPIGKQFKNKLPVQITISGPDSEWDSIKQLYFTLISSAEKRVYIQSPYFIPDPSVSMALKVAALSGIDVRVIVTGVPDKKLPYWSAFTYFEDLLKAGVKVYHYQEGFMHAKTVSVDGEVCSIGTANMDVRSFHLNYELNTMIYDRDKARELERDFKSDLKKCKEFTLQDYENLSLFRKLRNSIARVFSPLL